VAGRCGSATLLFGSVAGIITHMTVQTFREMLARRPFQPVKLTLSSGQSYDIRHPEMAFLTRTSILIGTDLAEDGVPAEFKIVSLLHVASMEPLPSQAA
jgi:hypothetical protein